jgi:hypothetical protein
VTTIVAVGSVRSGGATTVAMLLAAWLEHAVLVESDPDGGVLSLRYRLAREPGLLSLASTLDDDPDLLLRHAQRLPGGLPVVVGPESADRATHLLRSAGAQLGANLRAAAGTPVVVDVGRLRPSSPATCVWAVASTVLVVARPRAEELVQAGERVRALAHEGADVAVVLCGAGPYSEAEARGQLPCDVLGVMPNDARGARALTEGRGARVVDRSDLARSARALAQALAARMPRPATTPGVVYDAETVS